MYNEIDELQKSVKSLEQDVHSMWKAVGRLQIISDNLDLENNNKSKREEVEQRVFTLGKVVSKLQVVIDNQEKSVRALKNENMEHKARINALERMLTDTRTSVRHLYGRSDENTLSHREYDEKLMDIEKLHKQYEGWKNAINKDISTLYSECHEISFNPKSDDKSLNCKKQDAIKIINDMRSNIDSILKDIK